MLLQLVSVHLPVLGVNSTEIFWFPDPNLKMLCSINLKLKSVIGHNQS